MSKNNKKICVVCNSNDSVSLRKAHNLYLCIKCYETDDYKMITKTRCKTEFKLNDTDLEIFDVHEVKNPHFRCAAPMKLYKLKEIKDYIQYKYIINNK